MNYSVISENVHLYPDSTVSKDAKRSADLITPRNTFVGFQLMTDVEATVKSKDIKVNADLPRGISGEYYRQIPVTVPLNTDKEVDVTTDWEIAKEYAERRAPYCVFDPLMPLDADPDYSGKSGDFLALKFTFRVMKDAPVGIYEFNIDLDIAGDKITVPVKLEVARVTIPDHMDFKNSQWFHTAKHPEYYGVEFNSKEHWRIIEQLALTMRRAHQNVFRLEGWMIKCEEKNGEYVFDFSIAERVIKLFLSLGFDYIEGPLLLWRKGWASAEFYITVPGKTDVRADSEESYEYLSKYIPAMRDFIISHGWKDIFYQHVGDEPLDNSSCEYRMVSGIIRKYAPEFKIMDAVEICGLEGAVDIWVIKNHFYERNRERLEKIRARGNELWIYTCNMPGGKYANRHLDMPLLRTRMIHWGNYVYNIGGYLHWGYDYYTYPDVFTDYRTGTDIKSGLPCGESYIVYPYKKHTLISSRHDEMREGIEDYYMLGLLPEEEGRRIAGKCFRRFDDCDNEVDDFEKIRRELIEAASETL